jgi:hypothetical protein
MGSFFSFSRTSAWQSNFDMAIMTPGRGDPVKRDGLRAAEASWWQLYALFVIRY